MGYFKPPQAFPRPGAFRLSSFHFPENTRRWKKIFNGRGYKVIDREVWNEVVGGFFKAGIKIEPSPQHRHSEELTT